MKIDRVRQRLRRTCMAFPEAQEIEAWGDPTYRVRNKIFAMEKGSGTEVWFKGEPGAQAAVIATEPECFFVPPYVGNKGWIGAHLEKISDWDQLEELVEISYQLIAPKRLAGLRDQKSPSGD